MKKLSLLLKFTIASIIISSCTEKKEFCDCISENPLGEMTESGCKWINALSSEEKNTEREICIEIQPVLEKEVEDRFNDLEDSFDDIDIDEDVEINDNENAIINV